jgi:oligoendopeptidase F
MASPIKAKRPGDYPRLYVTVDADLGDWTTLEKMLTELEHRELSDVAGLQQWLVDSDELTACLCEEASRRNIEMTCATDDKEAESRHLHMITQIWPLVKPIAKRLNDKYLTCPHRKNLDQDHFKVFDRDLEMEVKLFRDENVELEKQDGQLSQQHSKITGAMMVIWQGEEKTLQQMAIYQESTDRAVREETWRLVTDRRMQDCDALNSLYTEMVGLRDNIAHNADYPNYLQYAFPMKSRFDYTPADCVAFHDATAECAVPFLRKLDSQRKIDLGLDTLRPWDLAVDPKGRGPLRPFKNGEELARGCLEVFKTLDDDVAATLKLMIDKGLLDLDSRKGKAPGGYQASLTEMRLPFIFMNAAGTDSDVSTLLHEGGHATHAMLAKDIDLLHYRHAPLEFCEVASMGLELLCNDKLSPFYNEEEAARSLRQHLEGTISFLPWCATIDAFQHWVYQNPGHSLEERAVQWRGLVERFGHEADWSGLEDCRDAGWQRQSHLFSVPFYYIEYGIAQLGSLQLWANFRQDKKQALADYKKALSLGGSRPLPELFEAAGLKFDLSRKTLEPLVKEVEKVLATLPE